MDENDKIIYLNSKIKSIAKNKEKKNKKKKKALIQTNKTK